MRAPAGGSEEQGVASATRTRRGGDEHLSPAFAVVLRHSGLMLTSSDGSEPIPITCPELHLLAGLAGADPPPVDDLVARVAAATDVDAAVLTRFVDHLRTRALLRTPVAATSTAAAPDAPPMPAAEPIAADARLLALTPLVFRTTDRGFELLDHDGRVLVRLDPAQLAAAAEFRAATTTHDAYERHRQAAGVAALDEARFAALVADLATRGVLVGYDPSQVGGRENRDAVFIYRYYLRLSKASDEACAAQEAVAQQATATAGHGQVPLVPIDSHGNPLPLALGMILAHVMGHKDGLLQQHYRIVPDWITRRERLPARAQQPSIFLFSNYIWSHGQNLSLSETVKRESPFSLTLHGGPDTPKYEGDVETYFRENPHVDIAVHGEGEETTAELLEALIGAVGDGPPDLSALRDVPGLSYRDGDRVVHTGKRDRLVDLDAIPSPFITGLFDVHAQAGPSMAIVETNRGCPYGCTFCDWGSATLSRIRKFDLDRVFAELEWCAEHHIPQIFLADANFGILERDVEIAEKVAELKRMHGYPTLFSTNYAKNTTKHLKHIVGTLADAGILNQGLLSLQSMDADVLKTVKRSNIKTAKYDDLAREFRAANLPLFVDLMLGLPGATQESFRADLQGCIDREVTAKVYPTELLVNSPMNEPGYRELNRIETSAPLGSLVRSSRNADGTTKRALVVSTASFSRDDYEHMLDLRRVFLVCDNFGVLRQVSRFIRQETGLREIELYEQLRLAARTDAARWPALAFTTRVLPFVGTAPVSWALLVGEVRSYATDVLGMPDDSALDTVLRVQHGLLPTRGRQFPVTLELPHDYAAWHRAMVEVKDAGNADWEHRVPRLRDLAPGVFTIDDPYDVCGRALGISIDENLHGSWELASSVARAVSHEHLWDAEAV
jgi:hypothetical protein